MPLVLALLSTLRAALKARTDFVLENLALRQQLALLRRRSKRPRVGLLDVSGDLSEHDGQCAAAGAAALAAPAAR